MSKKLLILIFTCCSVTSLAQEAVEKIDWHSKVAKGYTECNSALKDTSETGVTKFFKSDKNKETYKKCDQSMTRLKNFVDIDGQIDVDPEKLDEELQAIASEHSNHLKSLFFSEGNKLRRLSYLFSDINDYEVFKHQVTNAVRNCEYTQSEYSNVSYTEGKDSSNKFNLSVGLDSMDIDSVEESAVGDYSKNNPLSLTAANNEKNKKDCIINIENNNERQYINKIVKSCDESNIYLEPKSTILDQDKGELSFITPTNSYFETIGDIVFRALCNKKKKSYCDNLFSKVNTYDQLITMLAESDIVKESASESGLEGVRAAEFYIGMLSFNMVGHCYEKKKLEFYVAVEHGQGNFDEASDEKKYFKGVTGSECFRRTRYTVDHKACVGIVGSQNAVVIGDAVSKTAGGVMGSLHQQSIQRGYQKDLESGKSNIEAGLESQRRNFQGQRNIATTASATYGASAGTLTTMLTAYPSPGSFSRKCKDLDIKTKEERGINYCYLLHSLNHDDGGEMMFANQGIKNAAWSTVGQLGAESLKQALASMHYNDMLKQTKGMQNDLNNALEEVATIGFDSCQANPELCNQGSGTGETSTFSMGSFNMGGVGTTDLAYTKPTESIGETDNGSSISKTVANKLSDSLSESGNDFSNKFKKIGAGSLKQASSGGASGGGSAGGGGGGGGGGSDPAAAAGSGSSQSGVPGVKASWNKGSGVSYKRGKGNKKSKKASPYGNLFNKNKGSRNIASEVNDIASKDSGLFKKISKRYEKLSSSNRLKKF